MYSTELGYCESEWTQSRVILESASTSEELHLQYGPTNGDQGELISRKCVHVDVLSLFHIYCFV